MLGHWHTLYGAKMPTFGKDHSNAKCRTFDGMTGFPTTSGHFMERMWGRYGAALCGATVDFETDPVLISPGTRVMAPCCLARYYRIARRLGHLQDAPAGSFTVQR